MKLNFVLQLTGKTQPRGFQFLRHPELSSGSNPVADADEIASVDFNCVSR